MERIEILEKKLEAIEKHLGIRTHITTRASELPGPLSESRKAESNINFPKEKVQFAEKLNLSSAPSTSQSKSDSAMQLLPLVAVICFVLAGIFIVRLAIDSGWLTAERQWGAVLFLGASLLGAGYFTHAIPKDYRTYLSAAGIIVLYIAAYSSALYFHILPGSYALFLALVVSGICIGLSYYHELDFFNIITSIGTYLSPLLLEDRSDILFHGSLFLIWAFVFSTLSMYLKSRILTFISAYLGIGVFTLLYQGVSTKVDIMTVLLINSIQFFTFCYGVYFYSFKHNTPMSQEQSLAYLPVLLFFYGTLYYFLDRLSPGSAPWISLVFASFLLLLFQRARRRLKDLNSDKVIHCFLGVVLFHSGYLQILPAESKPWLLPFILLMTYIAERKDVFGKISVITKFIFSAVAIIEFGKICFALLSSPLMTNVFPALLTVIIGFFYYLKGSQLISNKALIPLGLVHTLAVLSLYRLAEPFGSLAVSSAWGVYSVLILGIGVARKDKDLSRSSLLVLLITGLKALVYDASQSPSGVRILSLLFTGVILYLAGLMFKKINNWKKS